MEEHRHSSSSNSDSDTSNSSETASSESNSSNSSDSNNQEQLKNNSVPQNNAKDKDSEQESNSNNSDSNSEQSDSNSNSSNTSDSNSDSETNSKQKSNDKNSQSDSTDNAKTENDKNKTDNNQASNVDKAKSSSDSNSESSNSNSDSESTSSKQNQAKPEVNTTKSADSSSNQPEKSNADSDNSDKSENDNEKPNNQNQIQNENEKAKTKSSASSEDSDNEPKSTTQKVPKKSDNDEIVVSRNLPKQDKDESTETENESEHQSDNPQSSSDQNALHEPKKLFDFTVIQDGLDPNRKTDRFGWVLEENSEPPPPKTKKAKKKLEKDKKQEQLRETKWIFMMKPENWPKFYDPKGKYRKVLERRVMKGIPDGVRSVAWRLILDPESISNPSRPTVEYYSDLNTPQCDHIIRVDIPRTMPRVPIFARKDIRTSLYVILRAYSNLDRELDYFQGMGFIAAILVSYMDETSAFWSFEKIMKGELHMQRNFYFSEFKGLHNMNQVWDIFLKNKFPTVHRNVTTHQLSPMLYTPIWFLTCFMAVEFQPLLKLRIFDRYTLFGTRAILSFGATIIDLHKDELSTYPLDKIIQILNHPQNNPKLNEIDNVLKHYDKNFISKRDYDKYCKKAGFDPIP